MKKVENRVGYRCAAWKTCSPTEDRFGRRGKKEECRHYSVHELLFNCLQAYNRACKVRCIFVRRRKKPNKR